MKNSIIIGALLVGALICGTLKAQTPLRDTASAVMVDRDTKQVVRPPLAQFAQSNGLLRVNGASYTNVIKTADAKTNTIIVVNGQVTSWVITQ